MNALIIDCWLKLLVKANANSKVYCFSKSFIYSHESSPFLVFILLLLAFQRSFNFTLNKHLRSTTLVIFSWLKWIICILESFKWKPCFQPFTKFISNCTIVEDDIRWTGCQVVVQRGLEVLALEFRPDVLGQVM